MIKSHVPERGDVYLIDPDPQGRDTKSRHRFIVITRSEINQLGAASTVPVSSKSGSFNQTTGLTVAIHGYDTTGVAVCNQVRTFDIIDKLRQGSAKFVERLNDSLMMEIINRVVSIIDPA